MGWGGSDGGWRGKSASNNCIFYSIHTYIQHDMYFYSIISCRLFKLMCIVSVCLTMSVNIISHLFILINFSIAYMSSCLRFIKINISYRHAVHCIAIVLHHYIHSVNRLFPPTIYKWNFISVVRLLLLIFYCIRE